MKGHRRVVDMDDLRDVADDSGWPYNHLSHQLEVLLLHLQYELSLLEESEANDTLFR